jgi:hypothetical protein
MRYTPAARTVRRWRLNTNRCAAGSSTAILAKLSFQAVSRTSTVPGPGTATDSEIDPSRRVTTRDTAGAPDTSVPRSVIEKLPARLLLAARTPDPWAPLKRPVPPVIVNVPAENVVRHDTPRIVSSRLPPASAVTVAWPVFEAQFKPNATDADPIGVPDPLPRPATFPVELIEYEPEVCAESSRANELRENVPRAVSVNPPAKLLVAIRVPDPEAPLNGPVPPINANGADDDAFTHETPTKLSVMVPPDAAVSVADPIIEPQFSEKVADPALIRVPDRVAVPSTIPSALIEYEPAARSEKPEAGASAGANIPATVPIATRASPRRAALNIAPSLCRK